MEEEDFPGRQALLKSALERLPPEEEFYQKTLDISLAYMEGVINQEKLPKDPHFSKPVGYYSGDNELRNIFVRYRLLGEGVVIENSGLVPDGMAAAVMMTAAIASDSEIYRRHTALFELYEALSSPVDAITPEDLWRFIHDRDVRKILTLENELEALHRQIRELPKYRRIKSRPEFSKNGLIKFVLMPYPAERFRELARRYDIKSDFEEELRQRIRQDNISFEPDQNSGWNRYKNYGFQIMKGLIPADERRDASGVPKETKNPEDNQASLFTVEPSPLLYLNRARGYRHVRDALKACFDYEQLRAVAAEPEVGRNSVQAYPELEMMISRMYGLHIISSREMGVEPRLDRGELSDIEYQLAIGRAGKWIGRLLTGEVLGQDPRDCLPVGETKILLRRFVVYLLTMGARLRLIEVEDENGRPSKVYITAEPLRDTVKIRRSIPPFSREEFRRICNRNKDRSGIINSMIYGGAKISFIGFSRTIIGLGMIAAAAVYLQRGKTQRHT